jgi:hypothetical protein
MCSMTVGLDAAGTLPDVPGSLSHYLRITEVHHELTLGYSLIPLTSRKRVRVSGFDGKSPMTSQRCRGPAGEGQAGVAGTDPSGTHLARWALRYRR